MGGMGTMIVKRLVVPRIEGREESVRPVPLIPQILRVARRIIHRRHWPDCAAFSTHDGHTFDLVAAHRHERRSVVSAEGTGAEVCCHRVHFGMVGRDQRRKMKYQPSPPPANAINENTER